MTLMTVFFDTHAHLTFPDFSEEMDAVIGRACENGITRIITIGTDLASSQRAVELAAAHESVYAVVGWHPNDLDGSLDDIRPDLRELAGNQKVVAIGETGIDHYRLPSSKGGSKRQDEERKEWQVRAFIQQLELAVELGLNVVIHQRAAIEKTLEIFEPFADRVRGQFHCFVNDKTQMSRIVEMNSLVSFTGILTFKNSQEVRDTLKDTPMDSFMLETDSPFLAPVPYRGKRCEPAYVREIAETAALVKGCTMEELSEVTCSTARQFFFGLV